MAELSAAIESAGEPKEFMAFRVGPQEFCVEVASVREARVFTAAARLPHAPDYLTGVINLRGVMLPIVDLRVRLALPPSQADEKPVVVVVAIGRRFIGILVDAVCDIVSTAQAAIAPAPAVEEDAMRDVVKSVITLGKRIIGVIVIEQILPCNADGIQ